MTSFGETSWLRRGQDAVAALARRTQVTASWKPLQPCSVYMMSFRLGQRSSSLQTHAGDESEMPEFLSKSEKGW